MLWGLHRCRLNVFISKSGLSCCCSRVFWASTGSTQCLTEVRNCIRTYLCEANASNLDCHYHFPLLQIKSQWFYLYLSSSKCTLTLKVKLTVSLETLNWDRYSKRLSASNLVIPKVKLRLISFVFEIDE